MGWTYGERPLFRRRSDLDVAALNAEWDAPEGELGKVVRQLRRRGEESRARAFWIFQMLIVVILAGLAFYLGLPFWQQYVDGRRLTLSESVDAIDAAEARLASDLAVQWGRLSTG